MKSSVEIHKKENEDLAQQKYSDLCEETNPKKNSSILHENNNYVSSLTSNSKCKYFNNNRNKDERYFRENIKNKKHLEQEKYSSQNCYYKKSISPNDNYNRRRKRHSHHVPDNSLDLKIKNFEIKSGRRDRDKVYRSSVSGARVNRVVKDTSDFDDDYIFKNKLSIKNEELDYSRHTISDNQQDTSEKYTSHENVEHSYDNEEGNNAKNYNKNLEFSRKSENIKKLENCDISTKKEVNKELEKYASSKITKITPEFLGRTGGVYIPPFKLERLRKTCCDTSSVEYQRQLWEALKKTINGIINRVNVSNIKCIVMELFKENLIRARGLLARSILKAQLASPGFTHIYAALLAVVNSKLSQIGDLVIRRLLLQFRRAYKRNDKIVCSACVSFMAHLINQKVIHELLALQLGALFLEELTDDSVELCVKFMQETGQVLYDICPQGFNAILERFRGILHEGLTDKRVQYMIENFFDIYRKKFKDFPGVLPELDLVDEENQITHEIDLLDPDIVGNEMLNIFKAEDPEEFSRNEESWSKISKDILGDDGEDSSDNSDSTSDDSESDEDLQENSDGQSQIQIKDMTEQDIINLRKTIYLTIMSSASYEECVHKLLKINIKKGCEIEVCTMLIDCCAMERTFQKFFALQAERLCRVNPLYQEYFLECLKRQYETVHRLETNKLRNTAKFFAHLLYRDSIPWSLLELFVLTENTTTSASRIFIKIIFQELSQHMGVESLYNKLYNPALQPFIQGIFPSENPQNMRFAVNFFTAIGLGVLTTTLRQNLSKTQAKNIKKSSNSEDSSTSTTSESDSSSNSDSEDNTDRSSDTGTEDGSSSDNSETYSKESSSSS